jgi:hypothetical protein
MYPAKFTITWGPSLWRFLHVISFTYPDKPTASDEENYRKFFLSLGEVIPCPGCAKHYKEYVAEHPIAFETKDSLSRWMYDFHNHVNATKPVSEQTSITPSFEDIKYFYTNWDDDRARKIQSLSPGEIQRVLGSPFMQTEYQSGTTTGVNVFLFLFLLVFFGIFLFLLRYAVLHFVDKKKEN